ncbi:MAG: hypothetical protein H0X05_01430 [Actinobacteria bacterium]|nr:hypothetical protein [Actinomycetota bacterium]
MALDRNRLPNRFTVSIGAPTCTAIAPPTLPTSSPPNPLAPEGRHGSLSFLAATAEHPTMLATGIIDLDRGRLMDVLPARSAVAVTDWLGSKPAPWLAGIRHAVIDPFTTTANHASSRRAGYRHRMSHHELRDGPATEATSPR